MTMVAYFNGRKVGRAAVAALLGVSLVAGACTNPDGTVAEKTTLGAAAGAAGGGLLGAALGGKATGIAAGVLLGGLLGGAAGSALDQRDRQLAAQNASSSLENIRTGTTTTWHNPDTGHEGTFTPTRTYQTDAGQYCREYQQTVTVAGEEQQSYGTACRQPDGTWKIVN